ncbi:MAG: hypothetical protein QXP04_01215 [Candidatus Nanoarchaeia archaeon]|nr:hypothetical protein [Candidatus Jingweiarchaeum tengchongense]
MTLRRLHSYSPKEFLGGRHVKIRFNKGGRIEEHLVFTYLVKERMYKCPFCKRHYSKEKFQKHLTIHEAKILM